jgi:hypothetical protein
MASAPASAALSTAADNGAAKPAEKQPVQVSVPTLILLLYRYLRFCG